MTTAGDVNVTRGALPQPSRAAGSKAARGLENGRPVDLPASPADPLAVLLRSAPPLGAWVADASCADLGLEASEVFTSEHPDRDELALAESVCWRCPVRAECADFAAQVPSWGLWGADWHTGRSHRARAA